MRLNGFRWGPKVSRSQMVIHSPQPANGSPNSRWAPRTGSLYEDIPLFGMFDICVCCRLSSHFYKIVDFCVFFFLLCYIDARVRLLRLHGSIHSNGILLVFWFLTEEPQKSYSSRRPTVHEVFSLSHNRSTTGGIVDGYGIFFLLFLSFLSSSNRIKLSNVPFVVVVFLFLFPSELN